MSSIMPIAFAARLLRGPAEMALTRIPLLPRLWASCLVSICKAAASLEPTQVGGEDVNVNDATAAYTKLQDMAERLRARSATPLSKAQAFSRVFQDPANKALAEAAHRRPAPTSLYEFPRSTR